MDIREGTEADLEAIATLAGIASETARGLLRDRRVRVGTIDGSVVAVLCFHHDLGRIHITRLCGDESAFEALIRDPVRVAREEGVSIETVVPDSDRALRGALEAAGFTSAGPGPRFDGEATTWFRLDPC